MQPTATYSTGAKISLYILTLLGFIGGWLILVSGGFHSRLTRFPYTTIFVEGFMAVAMVAIEFVLTAIGVAAIIQMKKYSWQWYIIGCGLVIVPPVVFVLTGLFWQ